MLFYGDSSNIVMEAKVFNLTSMKEGYPALSRLIPPNYIGLFTDREFDIQYANYIMSNDYIFFEFFTIIYSLYSGEDVYIIVSNEDWSENLIESLLKLIQQRYGYNGTRINCFYDYINIKNSKYFDTFAPGYGIQNLDMDKERYSIILANQKGVIDGRNI